jgi:hypothetical protein
MKKVSFFFVIIQLAINSYSQTEIPEKVVPDSLSDAEKFFSRTGCLIEKEFINIGSIKKCDIDVVFYTDMNTLEKINALNFRYVHKEVYYDEFKNAFLDVGEIEGIITATKIIIDKVLPTTANVYKEYSYKSRSGFEIGCFSKNNSWNTFIKLTKNDNYSIVFMGKNDLDKLLVILQRAKLKMQ